MCAFYGLPPPEAAGLDVAGWLRARLQRPPVAGDSVEHGVALVAARSTQGARIGAVGLQLCRPPGDGEPDAED